MNNQTLTSYLKLLACEGIGVVHARRLLDIFNNVDEIFNSDNKIKFEKFGVAKSIQDAILNFKNHKVVEDELLYIKQNNIHCLGILENRYPKLLKECTDAPILLFYKGDISLLQNNCLAIVGTRKISNYGNEVVNNLIDFLKPYQPTIVSGMAYGVDIAAFHQAKKQNLPFIGVMGTSFKSLYPAAHKKFYNDLFKNGLIITEYAGFNKLSPELFTRRNRIIAGLCKATVVIESAFKGGSLSTAYFANDYNRDVFAIPGRVNDEGSAGCLRLIQENRAEILFDFNQITNQLYWNTPKDIDAEVDETPKIDLNNFTENQQKILNSLTQNNLHIDELAIQTQLDISALNAELMMLELDGVVVGLPGKIFKLK